MTKYLDKKFSVPLGGKAYGDGWDRIFGKRECTCGEASETDPSKTLPHKSDCESTLDPAAEAAALREEADRLWDLGLTEKAAELHEKARKLGG